MRLPIPASLPLPGSTNRRLARAHNINDLRTIAKRRLPRVIFDFADGAAEDEVTKNRNNSAFQRYDLIPRTLVDVSHVDLSTTLLGQSLDLPFILAPTGGSRYFHRDGEVAVARAAHRAGTIYSLSSMSTTSIEDVAAASPGPRWFQIYVWRDRAIVREFFDRCRDTNYDVLCLTVDVPVHGHRERDLHNGFTLPPNLTAGAILDTALHPNWWLRYLTDPKPTLSNVVGRGVPDRDDIVSLGDYVDNQFDPAVTWTDLEWMVEAWDGPFAIKGILHPDDAIRAVDMGVRAIIVSNHGGRQLDQAPAAIDALPAIVDAVGGRAEIILDGGIRRGADIVKALALGANACMIGRAYLYGLAAAGEPGVDHALAILRDETRRTMALIGATSIDQIDSSVIRSRLPD